VYSRPLCQKGKIQGLPSTVVQLAPALEEGVVDTLSNVVIDVVAVGVVKEVVDDMVVEAEVRLSLTPRQLLLQKPHLLSTMSPSKST